MGSKFEYNSKVTWTCELCGKQEVIENPKFSSSIPNGWVQFIVFYEPADIRREITDPEKREVWSIVGLKAEPKVIAGCHLCLIRFKSGDQFKKEITPEALEIIEHGRRPEVPVGFMARIADRFRKPKGG